LGATPRRKARLEAGTRLAFARQLAGFSTVSAAAKHFSWNRRTYASHESGLNGFTNEQAAASAIAFGVRTDWLMSARGPSGYSAELDDWIEKHPEELTKPRALAAYLPCLHPSA
jgi:hypothetical protein